MAGGGRLFASTEADPELERIADEVIELIARAQHQDGYLNTYFTVKEPERRWTNLQNAMSYTVPDI